MRAQAAPSPAPLPVAGVLFCGYCVRRMQGEWKNQAPYYRCRFPLEYALANKVSHPRNVYLREDAIVPGLDRWLLQKFAPCHLTVLVEELYTAQDSNSEAAADQARRKIAECDRKLGRHRAALESSRMILTRHSSPDGSRKPSPNGPQRKRHCARPKAAQS